MQVTDVLPIECVEFKSENSNRVEESEVVPLSAEHVSDTLKDGLIKPKPKRTRLQCMDCGPIEGSKGKPTNSLGKRRDSE